MILDVFVTRCFFDLLRKINTKTKVVEGQLKRKRIINFRMASTASLSITITFSVLTAWITASIWQIRQDRKREMERHRKQLKMGIMTEIELEQDYIRNWHLCFLRTLPFRTLSRAWGRLHEMPLPIAFRSPLYKLWAWLFNCDLTEMAAPSLDQFPNLQSFFIRALKAGCRPINKETLLVSPADGTILHFGPIKEQKNQIEQIKGVNYQLDAFLGVGKYAGRDEEISQKLLQNVSEKEEDSSRLYHCVIYLAPGDYHRFHSPANWICERTKHFAGTNKDRESKNKVKKQQIKNNFFFFGIFRSIVFSISSCSEIS